MQFEADPVKAKQHDSEEARLEEEGGQHLKSNHGADGRPRHLPKSSEDKSEL
jgi:hypothetical protein